MRRLLAQLLMAASLAAWAGPLHAAGRFSLHGGADLRESYDDNVFLLSRGAQGSSYTTIAPILSVAYRGPRVQADAESGATLFLYAADPELNENFWHERLHVAYLVTPRLRLEGEELFTSVVDVIGRPDDVSTNLVQANTWRVGPVFRSQLGSRSRMEISTDYGWTNYVHADFEDGQAADFGESNADLYLDRELSENITLFTRQEFSDRRFPDLPSSSFTGILSTLGARWRPGRRIGVEASGGYQEVFRHDAGSQPGSVVDVSVRYSPTLRTRVTAAYSQEFTTDIEGTLYWQKRADVGLERQLGPRTLLRLTSFYSQLSVGAEGKGDNNYLGGGVKLEHRLRRRVLVDATWNYWKNGGGTAFDDFTQNVMSVGLRYEF